MCKMSVRFLKYTNEASAAGAKLGSSFEPGVDHEPSSETLQLGGYTFAREGGLTFQI